MDWNKLKVYYFDSFDIVKGDIVWGLVELGVTVEAPYGQIPLDDYEEKTLQDLIRIIPGCDAVFTQNFSRVVAEACYQVGKQYISWVYDSPQKTLYDKEALYETNFIFMFDKMQICRLQKIGIKNIFYSPLAANILRANQIALTEEDEKKYTCDISFVGNFYQKKYLEQFFAALSEEGKKDLDAYLKKYVCFYNPSESAFGTAGEHLRQDLHRIVVNSNAMIEQEYLEDVLILTRLLAREERKEILSTCSKCFNTVVYTNDTVVAKEVPGLQVKGAVNYETDLFRVNAFSKICLSTTLKSIESGVIQRVFDILSIGGFVLSDPQPELFELFEVGKEVEVYHSMEELKDKASYYLTHERERLTIALNGYKRVAKDYSYSVLLNKILETVFGT